MMKKKKVKKTTKYKHHMRRASCIRGEVSLAEVNQRLAIILIFTNSVQYTNHNEIYSREKRQEPDITAMML